MSAKKSADKRSNRRIRRQCSLRLQTLEHRLTLYAVPSFDAGTLTIENAGVTGEEVYITVDANGVVVQSSNAPGVTPYWFGGQKKPPVLPGEVVAIKVKGSNYGDDIDLTGVTRGVGFINAGLGRGSIVVDCSAANAQLNNAYGDVIKLGDYGEKATGSPYADTITCGQGGDTVVGNGGADTIHGGNGIDTLSVSGNGKYDPPQGTAEVEGGGGNDTIKATGILAELYGDSGNDKITGSVLGSHIDGGPGNDTLKGG